MSNERNELAREIYTADPWIGGGFPTKPLTWSQLDDEDRESFAPLATAILAAGYRKPRTITTVEELDALPEGSVILDQLGLSLHKNIDGWGASTGVRCIPLEILACAGLPATVLHTPEATQ